MKDKQLASVLERRGSETGEYPPDWPEIARRTKELASGCCERCGVRNNEDEPDGTMLTVHHLSGEKWLCEQWNLAALCQQCHLRVQARVVFYRPYFRFDWRTLKHEAVHSEWLARHIKGYNVWAMLNDKPTIPLDRIESRDYSKEWPKRIKLAGEPHSESQSSRHGGPPTPPFPTVKGEP